MGRQPNGVIVRILMHDLRVTIVHADTGEIIRDLTLDCQPLTRKPGTAK